MPTLEGFILPYYVSAMGGAQCPVNVEDMHIYRDGRDEFRNGTAAKAVQSVLEAEQTEEA